MKKIILTALFGTLVAVSCGKKEEAKESNTMLPEPTTPTAVTADSAKATTTATAADPLAEGKTLIAGADCLTCHKEDAKLIGPAYQDVAKKYEATDANVDMLADKVIKGGQGVWGNVPMAAHAGMDKENAKKMVKYILSLKK